MLYKTMILELLQDRYPALHERLRSSKRLLITLDQYAAALKTSHEEWKQVLLLAEPESDPTLRSQEALGIAIQEFEERILSSPLPADGADLFLDAAMSYIRRHTPQD